MKRNIQLLMAAVITLSLLFTGCKKDGAVQEKPVVIEEASKALMVRNVTMEESEKLSKVNFGIKFSAESSTLSGNERGKKRVKISQALAQATLATWTQLGSISATYVATPSPHINVSWNYDTTQFTPPVSPPAKCIVWTMGQKMYSSDGVNIDVLPSDDPQNIQLIASPFVQWTQSWITSWNGIEVLVNHANAPKTAVITDNWPFGSLAGIPAGGKLYLRVSGSYGIPVSLSSAESTDIWYSEWIVLEF